MSVLQEKQIKIRYVWYYKQFGAVKTTTIGI